MKRTGGPGERVDLSYLQDSAGGGGRRGWAARKLLKERGIEIFRKLSPDSSWEADSGAFWGAANSTATLDWPSGRVSQLPSPDGRYIVYGMPYQPGRAAGVLSASRVHASLRSYFAVGTGHVENGAIRGAALANHQTEVRVRTEVSCWC
jgi:hypothetical protein